MFSMCSELTPRARIPDTRIPQLMQPWLLERFLEHKLQIFNTIQMSKHSANAHVVTPLCPRSLPIYILMNSVILRNNVLQSLQHRGHVLQSMVVAKTDPGIQGKCFLKNEDMIVFQRGSIVNNNLSEKILQQIGTWQKLGPPQARPI